MTTRISLSLRNKANCLWAIIDCEGVGGGIVVKMGERELGNSGNVGKPSGLHKWTS
jgi:hypothetical protein